MIIKDGGCASQPQRGQSQRKITVRSGTVVRWVWVCGTPSRRGRERARNVPKRDGVVENRELCEWACFKYRG